MITQEEIKRDYVDGPQAASILGVSDARIRQLCLKGRFQGALKTGKAWLIPRKAVQDFQRLPPGVKPKTPKREDDKSVWENALAKADNLKGENNHD